MGHLIIDEHRKYSIPREENVKHKQIEYLGQGSKHSANSRSSANPGQLNSVTYCRRIRRMT